MKQKFVTTFFGILIIGVMAVPTVFAASQYSWSFTMDRAAVYGNENGEYYNLSSDVKEVIGDIWVYSKDATTTTSPLKVRVSLVRDTIGPDQVESSIYVTPNSTLNSKKNFAFMSVSSPKDKYYLRFEKSQLKDDGWNLKGAGNINN